MSIHIGRADDRQPWVSKSLVEHSPRQLSVKRMCVALLGNLPPWPHVGVPAMRTGHGYVVRVAHFADAATPVKVDQLERTLPGD